MCLHTQWKRRKVSADCQCRKARGLVKRLMMQVIIQLEHLFSWRHIYNIAGCSDGTFQCMPHPKGSNAITRWRQWAGWSRFWSQSFLGTGSNSICQVTLSLYNSALLSQSETI